MENVMGVVMLIHLASFCVGITAFVVGIIKKDFLMRALCSVSCMVMGISGFTLEVYRNDTFWMVFWIVIFFINLSSARDYYRYWIMQKTIEQSAKDAYKDIENLIKETEELTKQKEKDETDNTRE